MKKAKDEKNEQLMKELEAEAVPEHNYQMLQAFSIASVADILEKVKDQLPKAAKEAGVDILVSKWELAYQNPSFEIVDVTSADGLRPMDFCPLPKLALTTRLLCPHRMKTSFMIRKWQ